MCGIIGYIGSEAAGLEERLRAARDTMTHRGPDDAGLWQGGGACLGARRLAILDLSPAGHMPMQTVDARFTVVFNGAIYNHVELRRELSETCAFRSTGDTEVLLHGFREWGWRGLLERIDGMFAFAVWDAEARQLFAARDRAGEKPFFHARMGTGFAFASTLAALVHLRGGANVVDPLALDAYLTYQAVPAPLAILEGFAQLPPAHALRFDAGRGLLEVERYWDLRYAPKRRITEGDALDELEALTQRSVRQRLRSDVPTGTLLSGGVDSSLVTALASRETPGGIDAVTMGHDGDDERPFARIVAARYGVRLHEAVLAPLAVMELPAIVAQYGQPVADVSIVPNYHLAAAARRFMTVALVGDGADEVFGGYSRPVVERAAGTYRALPMPLRRAAHVLFARHTGSRRSPRLVRALSHLVTSGAGPARDAFVYDRAFRSLRDIMYAPGLLSAVGDQHPDALYGAVWDRAVATDDVDRALYGDFATYLPDQLLAKADVSSMAHGLETRSPFLARDILEFGASLPTSLRLRGFAPKYLLKRVAERYLPREVIHRPKRGFVVPASRWMRGDLAPHVRAVLDTPRFLDRGWIRPDAVRRLIAEHAAGSRDWGEQLWTLLVLETWARLTLDGSLRPGDTLDALLDGARP